MSETELLLQTLMLIVESASGEKKKNWQSRSGGKYFFKTVLEEKAEAASLFFSFKSVF